MGLTRVFVMSLLLAAAGIAVAVGQQAPGLGGTDERVDQLVRENARLRQLTELLQEKAALCEGAKNGAAEPGEVSTVVRAAPGLSGSDEQVDRLERENARLKRRAELLQEQVVLLRNRLRSYEESP